jgi:hypothetical protein
MDITLSMGLVWFTGIICWMKLNKNRQMSRWLGRPHLIDQKDLDFIFPNLRLDQSTSLPNHLSPFAHMALQAQLIRRITALLGDTQATNDLSADQISSVLTEIDSYMSELPPVFAIEQTDTSLDDQHPYYIFQRYQLHVTTYLTKLDFLKPYLAGDPRHLRNSKDVEFRVIGVELGLKLLDAARLLFDHEFPNNAKFHMVVFSIFDTATILCSAIFHDLDDVLPHREKVMDAIERALDMLHQLSHTTKLAASSYSFLFKLVQATPALALSPIRKRQRIEPTRKSTSNVLASAPAEIALPLTPPPVDLDDKQSPTPLDLAPVPDLTTTNMLSFDFDQFLAQSSFETSNQLDMGGMELIWDWQDLNLEGLVSQNWETTLDGNGTHLPGF